MDVQYNLLKRNDEFGRLLQEIEAIRISSNKVRKGVFVRQNSLLKEMCKLHLENESLRKELDEIKYILKVILLKREESFESTIAIA